MKREYNENKKVIREAYFGLVDEPVMSTDGYAAIERKYDADGNVTEELRYDVDGNVIPEEVAKEDAA